MAIATSFMKRGRMDLKEICASRDVECTEQSHCSSNSAPSEASSSSVTQHFGKSSSVFVLHSGEGGTQSKLGEETRSGGTRMGYQDEHVSKPSSKCMNHANSKHEIAVWTDEKHCSYLNSMEEAFIRNHYTGDFSVDMAHPLDVEEDDGCIESRPRIFESAFETSETLGSWKDRPKHLVHEEPVACLIECHLGMNFHKGESSLTLCRNEGKPSHRTPPVSFPDLHQSTTKAKRRKVEPGQDILDLELRLGDFQTRLFDQHHAKRTI